MEFKYCHKINEGYLYPIDQGNRPWDSIHIDHLGPLEKTKNRNKFIFEVIDGFSKFSIYRSTTTTNSEEAIKNLKFLFQIFGVPKEITTDRQRNSE